MARLAIMSDLHIDLNDFGAFETEALINTLQELDVDHLHLAGDISNHFEEFSLPFVEKLQSFFPVTYNLGNHDMLGMAEADIQQMDFQLHEIGQKQLLAFHGWYDYSFYPEVSVDKNLRTKNALWFDRRLNRNLSDPQITQKVLGQLDDKLSQLEPQNTIVTMHFVPHEHFTMTHPRFERFNAFLGSQAFHDLFQQHGIQDVVFGHAHRSYGDVAIDGVTYHSRPLGYRREWDLTIDFVNKHPDYNPTGTCNLSKRYNLVKKREDYQAYAQAMFKEELRKSITLFDC